MSKRAITLTNSEISMIFWVIYLIMAVFTMKTLWGYWVQTSHPILGNPQLNLEFTLLMFITVIGIFFSLMSVVLPNYLISKYNLNLLIDRISNPNWIGWIRFTRSKGLRFHIVKKGPLGQTKGYANDAEADVINTGDYTVTLQNGNQAIIKSDLLTTNINLEDAVGWQLIKKHYGVVGYKAWEKAADEGQLLFNVKKEEKIQK
jgi:hypothetical protein